MQTLQGGGAENQHLETAGRCRLRPPAGFPRLCPSRKRKLIASTGARPALSTCQAQSWSLYVFHLSNSLCPVAITSTLHVRTLRRGKAKQLAPGTHSILTFESNKETKECQKPLHGHRTGEGSSLDTNLGSEGPRPELKTTQQSLASGMWSVA